MIKVILPLSEAAVKEIAEQVTLRLQGDRVITLRNGKLAVDLGEIMVVSDPTRMLDKHSQCKLGVGCNETGICYAEAHGKPDECGAL